MTRIARWLVAAALLASPLAAQQPGYDVVIRNGRVLDGTGNPWYLADVGIRGDRIATIGRLDGAAARRIIDARGQIVAPGFIALHEHIDRGVLQGKGVVPNYLTQGFTTAVIGTDGRTSVWPIRNQRDSLRQLGHALVEQVGVRYVLVNGQLVVDAGTVTGALPGRVLERQRR